VAAAGAAVAGCDLVAHQRAAAVGEDRRTVDQARTLVPVADGGESPYAVAIREHAGEDRDAAVADGIRRAQSGAIFDGGTGLVGEMSVDAPGEEGHFGALRAYRGRNGWEHRGPIKPLHREVGRPILQLESERQKGNPG
jgi:hypothetical protein